ncbi:MAG: DUF2147 domain-containing protein [Sphingomonas bacterium]|nr:DUF2147 domain-containing protein [Sphingomonas bacterium]
MLLTLTLMLMAVQDGAVPIEGRWKNPSGSVIVSIAACGEAYCGTVTSASDGAKADAKRGGTEALVGTQLMTGFKAARSGKWRGRLFIPDLNHRSKAELRMIGAGQLKVTGCMVGRMICKSQIWTKAD